MTDGEGAEEEQTTDTKGTEGAKQLLIKKGWRRNSGIGQQIQRGLKLKEQGMNSSKCS